MCSTRVDPAARVLWVSVFQSYALSLSLSLAGKLKEKQNIKKKIKKKQNKTQGGEKYLFVTVSSSDVLWYWCRIIIINTQTVVVFTMCGCVIQKQQQYNGK